MHKLNCNKCMEICKNKHVLMNSDLGPLNPNPQSPKWPKSAIKAELGMQKVTLLWVCLFCYEQSSSYEIYFDTLGTEIY